MGDSVLQGVKRASSLKITSIMMCFSIDSEPDKCLLRVFVQVDVEATQRGGGWIFCK